MSDQRLINADTLKGAFEMDGYKSPYVERFIDACPTVDAVPVVRCKDCKRWRKDVDGILGCMHWYCVHLLRNTNPDDYCSYGEKKEDKA